MSRRFITRYDDTGANAARFYFSDPRDAESFARFFGAESKESSPPHASGGLYRVAVPYSGRPADALPWREQIMSAVEMGRAMLDRDSAGETQ